MKLFDRKEQDLLRAGSVALGLMVPALLAASSPARAFTYDASIPGVGENVVTRSLDYKLTDTSSTGSLAIIRPTGTNDTQKIINAISAAPDGTGTVVLGEGTWRVGEITVNKDITIRSEAGKYVYLDGAVPVSGWQRVSTSTTSPDYNKWWISSTNYEFLATSATNNSDPNGNLRADDGEMVFRDGKPYVQRDALSDINAVGEFYVNRSAGVHRLYIYSTGAPTNTEVTRYDFAFFLPNPAAAGSTIRGLNFRRFAGAGADGTVAERNGNVGSAVRVEGGSCTIDRCSFFWNGHAGLQTKGGSNTVTRSNFVSNGANGILAGAQNVDVSGNYIAYNNAEGFNVGWFAAGIKAISFNGSRIYDNFVEGNKGPGIWIDIYATGAQTFRNYVKGGTTYPDERGPDAGKIGTPNGIFVEISRDNLVAFNVITGAGAAIHAAASPNTRIYNNTLYNNKNHLYIHDEPGRSDPDLGGDNPNTDAVENELRVTAEARNNILLADTGNAVDAYAVSVFDKNTDPTKGPIRLPGRALASKKRFTALNYNVYPQDAEATALFKWQLVDGNAQPTSSPQPAEKIYNTLTAFRAADSADTDAFEDPNGITRDPNTVFENVGSRDFRISGNDAPMATQGYPIPAAIRALMLDNVDFVGDALTNPRCDLAAVGSLGATALNSTSNTSTQKHRGALRPTNASPSGTLTSPVNNARTLGAPASMTLMATAQDDDGTIAKVEFYDGSTKIGEATTPTNGFYQLPMSAAAGTHSLMARAIDNAGAIGDSTPVNHTVYARTLAINTGGPAATPFSADSGAGFGNGTTVYAAPTPPSVDVTTATNPAPLAVYQSERYGSSGFTYTATGLTPSANYLVRLHFAETLPAMTAAGQRLFGVRINGNSVLGGTGNTFDIFVDAGGANRALVKEFTVPASAGGQIIVDFVKGGADNPKINGIELLR